MYIANGMTVTTMNVIGRAGWKDFPEEHRRKIILFLRFATQSSSKPFSTPELNCSGQSKDSFLEQKFEGKEDKNIEVIGG